MKIPGENVCRALSRLFLCFISPYAFTPVRRTADNNKLNRKAVYAGFSPLSGKLNACHCLILTCILHSDNFISNDRKTHIPRTRAAGALRELRIAKLSESPRLPSLEPLWNYYEAAILPTILLAKATR